VGSQSGSVEPAKLEVQLLGDHEAAQEKRCAVEALPQGKPAKTDAGQEVPPLAIIPEYVTPRLRAQHGTFVAFGEDDMGHVKTAQLEPQLYKPILIDEDSLDAMESELMDAGATHSSIYPDIGGLCADLARRRFLRKL
jgi:hypothetical protein